MEIQIVVFLAQVRYTNYNWQINNGKIMTNQLATAIALASSCHEKQLDKGGHPYILHPLRVMMRLRTDDHELMCIAILHDVLEDCDYITSEELYDIGFSKRVIDGVIALTRADDESYNDFIKRCAQNPDARIVKLEDLRDNSDITRLKGLRQKDFDRMKKYQKAYMFLSTYSDKE